MTTKNKYHNNFPMTAYGTIVDGELEDEMIRRIKLLEKREKCNIIVVEKLKDKIDALEHRLKNKNHTCNCKN